MPDEQDRAESLDDDKGAFPSEVDPGQDLVDQTADAEPRPGGSALAEIDADESGNAVLGVEPDEADIDDPYHEEDPPPEVSAMHVIDDESLT